FRRSGRTARHPAAFAQRCAAPAGLTTVIGHPGRHRTAPNVWRDAAGSSSWWKGNPFAGVVCQMALMDIDDLDGTMITVATVLEPGGWFGFPVFQPCFPGASPSPPADYLPRVRGRRLVECRRDRRPWARTTRINLDRPQRRPARNASSNTPRAAGRSSAAIRHEGSPSPIVPRRDGSTDTATRCAWGAPG